MYVFGILLIALTIVCNHDAIALENDYEDKKTLHQKVILERVEKDPDLLKVVALSNHGSITLPFILPLDFYDQINIEPLGLGSLGGMKPNARSSGVSTAMELPSKYTLPALNRNSFFDEMKYQSLKRLELGSGPFVTIGWFDRGVVKFWNTTKLPQIGKIHVDFVCDLSHVNLLLLNDQKRLEVFTINENAERCEGANTFQTFPRTSATISIHPEWTHIVGVNLFNKNSWSTLIDPNKFFSIRVSVDSCETISTSSAIMPTEQTLKLCEIIAKRKVGMLVRGKSLYFELNDHVASPKRFGLHLVKYLDR